MVGDVAVAKNLTEKEYAEFIEKNTKLAKVKYKDLPNDEALVKYLQEIAEKIKLRKTAYIRWLNKFDRSFFNHLDGEFSTRIYQKYIESINYLFKSEVLVSQGGHRGSAIFEGLIELEKIIEPLGYSSLKKLPDDVPFVAEIKLRYKFGNLIKEGKSSMFPKNWDIKRIQEEVAYVYENTVAKRLEVFTSSGKFDKYRYYSSDGSFKIIIEIDQAKNIMNAYPHLN